MRQSTGYVSSITGPLSQPISLESFLHLVGDNRSTRNAHKYLKSHRDRFSALLAPLIATASSASPTPPDTACLPPSPTQGSSQETSTSWVSSLPVEHNLAASHTPLPESLLLPSTLSRLIIPLGIKNKRTSSCIIIDDTLLQINGNTVHPLHPPPCPGCSQIEPIIHNCCLTMLLLLDSVVIYLPATHNSFFSFLPANRTFPTSSLTSSHVNNQLACLFATTTDPTPSAFAPNSTFLLIAPLAMDLQIQTSITIAAHKVDLSFPITCPTHVCTGEAQTAVRIYFSVPSNCPHKGALHLLSFIGALSHAYSQNTSPCRRNSQLFSPPSRLPPSQHHSLTISHHDALDPLPANCCLVASDASAVGQTCSQVVTTVDGLLLSSSLIYGHHLTVSSSPYLMRFPSSPPNEGRSTG